MIRIFTVFYMLVLVAHIVLALLQFTLWEQITKPTLVISLILFFIAMHPNRKSCGRFSLLILLALTFSLFGDVLLLFQSQESMFFTAGLSAFLLAHVFYIWAFTRTYNHDHEIALIKKHGFVMVAVVAYGFLFFNRIRDHLGSLMGPVMIYTLVITLMLLIALNRFQRVGSQSFWFIAIGALLFVVSDSVLAWNKFVNPMPYERLLIMSTYGLAQLGIVSGAVWQVWDESKACN